MKPRHRRVILGSLLAATVLAALWGEDDEVAAPPVEAAARRRTVDREPASAAPSIEKKERDASVEAEAGKDAEPPINPFRQKTWYIAPPPPPPPAPKAPPLPFQYLGRLDEDGETQVFVNHQGRYLAIRAGDLIAGTYAVERVEAERVVFVYLPLKEKQALPLGPL